MASANGNLTLDAGGSVSLVESVSLNTLTLIAGETNGVDQLIQGGGPRDILLDSISITTVGAFSATANGGNVALNNAQLKTGSTTLHAIDVNGTGGDVLLGDSTVTSDGTIDLNATGGDVIIVNSTVAGKTVNLTATGSNIDVLQSSVVGDTMNVHADATVTVVGSIMNGGDVSIKAKALGLFGADESAGTATDADVDQFFDQLAQGGAGSPLGLFAVVSATRGLSVEVEDLSLNGGAADRAFASLVSFGEFKVAASNVELLAGTGVNSDATLLGLGGLLDLKFDTCVGCGDPFLTDPRADPLPQTGLFIAGVVADPAVTGILSMLDRADDNGKSDDDDEKKDEKKAKECGI